MENDMEVDLLNELMGHMESMRYGELKKLKDHMERMAGGTGVESPVSRTENELRKPGEPESRRDAVDITEKSDELVPGESSPIMTGKEDDEEISDEEIAELMKKLG